MRKGSKLDLHRTEAMAKIENQLWNELLEELGERQEWDPQWRENWLKSLRRLLGNCANTARQLVARDPDPQIVHEQRRLVAVYHQFYDLLSQGYPQLIQAASELRLLITGKLYAILQF